MNLTPFVPLSFGGEGEEYYKRGEASLKLSLFSRAFERGEASL